MDLQMRDLVIERPRGRGPRTRVVKFGGRKPRERGKDKVDQNRVERVIRREGWKR